MWYNFVVQLFYFAEEINMEKITVDEVKSRLEYKWHVLALKQNL